MCSADAYELQLLQAEDTKAALTPFDTLLFKHLAYTFNRTARSFSYGIFGGPSDASAQTDAFSRPFYKTINRFSANFALTADLCLGLLAGDIKRKEMLSGRLADIHSHLFIATAILKFYEKGQRSEAEQQHAQLALEKAFVQIQDAFDGLFANFPMRAAACLVKFICFPFGRVAQQPSDQLKTQVGLAIMENNPFREQLKQHVFYNTDPNDVFGRMENAFQAALKIDPLWTKFKKAESKGQFEGLDFESHIQHALETGFIRSEEADQLIHYNAQRFDSMLTDIFDHELKQTLDLKNPYHTKASDIQP